MALHKIRFTVTFPDGKTEDVEKENSSDQWANIHSDFRKTRSNANFVYLPPSHFHYSKRVLDVVRMNGGKTVSVESMAGKLRGCVVLVVESPHKDEYSRQGSVWIPGEPLTGARSKLDQYLPDAINCAGPSFSDKNVVLCNPVQLQASLAELMQNKAIGLQRDIRNLVWRRLFRIPAIKCDFKDRIQSYQPSLILVGTTGELAGPVFTALRGIGAMVRQVSPHPSWWSNSKPPIVREFLRPRSGANAGPSSLA
ncbi:MAG: hypothetical protein KAY22_07385 [Rhizorhabdus sp.]|uniref:hypothetical protein n=1 Tax=Rhizorhabdus sp. TaxID=1968843 RepID=UPI001B651D83|nr:hypothetical protein [Rhizorhabdus sp.]MBP8232111.1 hypothetical protein [Rhizorhabdus sp.]